mmetsp:Transcript_19704/g.47565  ORF Transcript_19704/g.47565 Transcript_19704/m.47565 type:complete len:712 (+) Transcript_19704:182-2317(+)
MSNHSTNRTRKKDAEDFLASGLAILNLRKVDHDGVDNDSSSCASSNNAPFNIVDTNGGGGGGGQQNVGSTNPSWNAGAGSSGDSNLGNMMFWNPASCFKRNPQQQQQTASSSRISSSYDPRIHGGRKGNITIQQQEQQEQQSLPHPSSSSLLTPKQMFGNRQHLISSGTLLARFVNQMTAREREQIMLEIHGIADVIDESQPGFLELSLRQMEKELSKIRQKHAMQWGNGTGGASDAGGGGGGFNNNNDSSMANSISSYEKALQQNPQYVYDPNFRILFLRATRFQPKDAAQRMVRYFREKERLFGEESLCRSQILFRDMSPKAIEIIEDGGWQVLPERDQGGRVIVFCAGKLIRFRTDPDDVLAALQAFWKIGEISMQDEESLKRGTVIVVYQLGSGPNSGEELRGLQRIGQSFPKRTAALHACVDDATTKMVIDLSVMMTGKDESRRYRCHSGSDVEVQYNLSTFGIPNRLLPIRPDGSIDNTNWLSFVRQLRVLENSWVGQPSNTIESIGAISTPRQQQQKQQQDEQKLSKPPRFSENTEVEYVMVPSQLDVLLGRGRSIQEHTGNLRCRHVVGSYRDRYDTASKNEKTEIIRRVVEQVHQWGGRFLERSSDGPAWCTVSDDHARYKISHGFRNHKRLAAQKKSAETSGNETGGSTMVGNIPESKVPSQKRIAKNGDGESCTVDESQVTESMLLDNLGRYDAKRLRID